MKYHVPRGVSSSFRLKGIFRIFFVANGEEAVSSRSRSEATIVVADRRFLRGEEEVEELWRWFKFLSSGKSPSIWGVAESAANSHALTGL